MALNYHPACGRRLLPLVLDEMAISNPGRLYAAIPKTQDVTQGFRDITVSDLARCVNFMAQWIDDRFGHPIHPFETLTYIGISDLRGPVSFLAALLLPSPRNAQSTSRSLMSQTASNKLLYAAEVSPIVSQLQEPSICAEAVPSFDEMINSNPKHYAFEKDFEEARFEPVVIFHSSGSTGPPKPITLTHGSFAALDNESTLPEIPGRRKNDCSLYDFDGEGRFFTVFPYFHVRQLNLYAIFKNGSPVLGPPNLAPDASLLRDITLSQKLRAMFVPPSLVEQALQEPDGLDLFKNLDFISYAGAPFNPVLGERLSKVVDLTSSYGSTEIFSLPGLFPAREDWGWNEFNPHVKHEMQVFDDTEGIFELVVIADERNKDRAAVYYNLPGLTEYRTKDLFIQHPDKPQLFKFYGRRDDIIVLANGEKFNPIPFEANLQNHPSVKGALVVGSNRTQPALVLEPREPLNSQFDRDQWVQDLWPLIEESNKLVAGQGRIHRGKVIRSTPERPFQRTAKGTTMRKATEKNYADEIGKLYGDPTLQSRAIALEPNLEGVYDISSVTNCVRTILAASFPQEATIQETDDLFSHGMDSVQSLEISWQLKHFLQHHTGKAAAWVSPRTIFQHPTISELSQFLLAFLNGKKVPQTDSTLSMVRTGNEIVAEYTRSLPVRQRVSTSTSPSESLVVVVIGSTGFLGSYLVGIMMHDPRISRIICLNRSPNAKATQEKAIREIYEKGGQPLAFNKLDYLTIKLGDPRLGLNASEYAQIAREADVVVYNAWRLNFGLGARSFSPFLRAARDLADLAVAGARDVRLVFVSSMTSVAQLAMAATAPEAPVEDPMAAFAFGYGQSKLAAERVLAEASRRAGVSVSIVRVCQVGGPSDRHAGRAWPEQRWISGIARTARTVRCLPEAVALVDWLPVDTVAAMVRDFAVQPRTEDEALQVFHVVHPSPLPWEVLASIMRDRLGITEMVSLPEWVSKVRDVVADMSVEEMGSVAALPMLDFYEALGGGAESVRFAAENATRASGARAQALGIPILERWIRDWNI
ncbi:hypothetical protein GGR52DRAFT_581433 [Hypoxylon sp. FL1284]|nr:hypothetical protein GGR52DRAFT_581433 [Hypoxylon sp. FL1284]